MRHAKHLTSQHNHLFFFRHVSKFVKSVMSLHMSVCSRVRPSVYMDQPDSHWMDQNTHFVFNNVFLNIVLSMR